ncbi:conserved hypothetical protein, partial [Listeria innocua FSL S4-378]
FSENKSMKYGLFILLMGMYIERHMKKIFSWNKRKRKLYERLFE